MNAPRLSSRFRQQGMVTVMVVIFLITAVIFALSQTLGITGSNSIANQQQLDSVAALFLAESGVESAQATLRAAAVAGTNTNTSCTGLINQSANLGSGSFTYTGAVSTPTLCGGTNPACTSCAVTVTGNVGSSSRRILTQMTANRTDGVEGQTNSGDQTQNLTPNFTLHLETRLPNSFAFTHLAYNPPSNWGGDATVGNCLNSGADSITSGCIQSWKIAGAYYNNTASQAVFASVPTVGTYGITESLIDPLTARPVDSRRNYVLTGILLSPASGRSISHVGSYASSPNNICVPSTTHRTQPVTLLVGTGQMCGSSAYQNGYLPDTWTCNPTNGTTANWSNAANADTLVVGFGGKPYYSGGTRSTNVLTGLSLNGQPIHQQLTMSGTQGDNMYSQIWYAYNTGYYSITAGGSSGAIFTGAVGGVVRGCIGSSPNACSGSPSTCTNGGGTGRTLRVCSVTSGALRLRDVLSGGSISGGTNITACPGGICGGTGDYTVDSGHAQNRGSTTITANSSVLRVTAVTAFSNTSSGVLSDQDIITTNPFSGHTLSYTTSSVTGGTAGTGQTGDYLLSGAQQVQSGGAAQTNQQSSGIHIAVFGASGTAPTAGTALGVPSGSGQFLPDSVTGGISGTTLTVTAASGTNLSARDALFGAGIKPNTLITARGTGTGGTGTYTVTPSQTAASGTIMARAAVVTVTSANSFTVSRLPDTAISGAQLCGGLCPFLLSDGTHTLGEFDLTNIHDYDDWSSGFACLSGVDPASIETVGTVMSKRSGWTELVQ